MLSIVIRACWSEWRVSSQELQIIRVFKRCPRRVVCDVQREDFGSTLTEPRRWEVQSAMQKEPSIVWFSLRLRMTIQRISSLLVVLLRSENDLLTDRLTDVFVSKVLQTWSSLLSRVCVLWNPGTLVCVPTGNMQRDSIFQINRIRFLRVWPVRLVPRIPLVTFIILFLLLCPASSFLHFSFLPLALLFLPLPMVLPVLLPVFRIPRTRFLASDCPLLLWLFRRYSPVLVVI